MPNFTAGTSFTDGVTNDVTAAKLNALIADAVPTSSLSLNSTTGTISQFSSGTGTAASPAIQPTGDTNTGIFFPAADTIAFSEGGTESMRIDSSGRVGVGTSSPAIAYRMSLTGDGSTIVGGLSLVSGGTTYIGTISSTSSDFEIFNASNGYVRIATNNTERLRIDSSGNVGIGATSLSKKLTVYSDNSTAYSSSDFDSARNLLVQNANTTTNANVGVQFLVGTNSEAAITAIRTGDGTADLAFGTRGGGSRAERLRIDSSGRVGIGTSSPAYTLDVSGSAEAAGNFNSTANTYIGISRSGTRNILLQASSTAGLLYQEANLPFVFGTNNTERLRITSAGEVYIAGTTDQGAYNLQVNGTGVWGAGAYVNGSDERLKENIQDITSGLDVVEKLRPVSFQYKENYTADRSVQSGFIAQDLLVALDGKNYLEGVVSQGPTYYNVAYQNLIPILAKAIQELKSENDSLKARIEILEAA